jgi:hypothetical protein
LCCGFDSPCFTRLPELYRTCDWQLQRVDVGNDYRAFVAWSGETVSIINKQFVAEEQGLI